MSRTKAADTKKVPLFCLLGQGVLTGQIADIGEIGEDRDITILVRNGLASWKHENHTTCTKYGKVSCQHSHFLYMTLKAFNYFGQSLWKTFRSGAKTSKLKKITRKNFNKQLLISILTGVD